MLTVFESRCLEEGTKPYSVVLLEGRGGGQNKEVKRGKLERENSNVLFRPKGQRGLFSSRERSLCFCSISISWELGQVADIWRKRDSIVRLKIEELCFKKKRHNKNGGQRKVACETPWWEKKASRKKKQIKGISNGGLTGCGPLKRGRGVAEPQPFSVPQGRKGENASSSLWTGRAPFFFWRGG